MRDPDGRLRFEGSLAIRELSSTGTDQPFLHQPQAQALVDAGRLVPFAWQSPTTLHSPRYAFVTQPTEWCDAQLHAAALLTLDIAQAVLPGGFELKDASAWNVVFDGAHPLLCDHLSFQPLCSRPWWAFGQFCRHFTFPLAAVRWRGMHGLEVFRSHRDGLSAAQARSLFGTRARFSRLLPLLMPGRSDAAPAPEDASAPPKPRDVLHAGVLDYARRSLFAPRPVRAGSPWAGYVVDRAHYSASASQAKLAQVRRWLDALSPATVLDLGCNTGEFSRVALAAGARVIAVDGDHDSVEQLFRSADGARRLHPVVANLADLQGGRGWNASEHAGLAERLAGQADLVLMLALNHHLHFSEGIPLDAIAAFAARMTSSHLMLEVLAETDPMVVRLAAQRRRSTAGFGLDAQLRAFAAHFEVEDRHALPGSGRQLLLMRRRR